VTKSLRLSKSRRNVSTRSETDSFSTDRAPRDLIPAPDELSPALRRKKESSRDRRTDTQDVTPLTLGQELTGHAAQVERAIARARNAERVARARGTAVRTGLNSKLTFARLS
jgi:fumarate hydratase, class II